MEGLLIRWPAFCLLIEEIDSGTADLRCHLRLWKRLQMLCQMVKRRRACLQLKGAGMAEAL